ncbi:MAG: DUF2191 domain-containing protein [Acidobacteria bacterium]|nr:DUF2191 domain-containing protein [Acidobacteriota bacterium]
MKTTVEISAPLLEAAKELAARAGTTLRALVETGLRRVLAEHRESGRAFVLPDRSVGGKGLRPEYQDADWAEIRRAAYEGRGG